jgi:hypothetical protein
MQRFGLRNTTDCKRALKVKGAIHAYDRVEVTVDLNGDRISGPPVVYKQ